LCVAPELEENQSVKKPKRKRRIIDKKSGQKKESLDQKGQDWGESWKGWIKRKGSGETLLRIKESKKHNGGGGGGEEFIS